VDAIHGIDCPTDPTPDNPAPCGDSGVPAADYQRYRDAIEAFGGVEGSITDSQFSETVRRIISAPQNTATTTTTTTATTTTTTMPSIASCPRACDDGDPCTADTCVEDVGCVHEQATGFGAITCLLDQFCGNRPLPNVVMRRIKKAKNLIARAQLAVGDPPKAVPFLGRASRRLDRGARLAARLAKRGKLPADCSAELRRVLGTARSRIHALSLQLRV